MEISGSSRGRTKLRLGITFFAVAILCQFLLFFVPGLVHGQWRGEMGGYFVVPSLFFAWAFPTAFLLPWFLGFPVILLASRLFHLIFGGNISGDAWQATTCAALWPLPYAFGMGSAAYMVYYLFHLGGWPDDVIFGTMGNALGAWCYVTIFWSWYRLKRSNNLMHLNV